MSSYALKIELLGFGAPRPFLSSFALKTQLLGSGAPRPFRLPSLGKACVALMRPSFLINSGPSVIGLCFPNFVLSLGELESVHDGASGFGHHCMGYVQ